MSHTKEPWSYQASIPEEGYECFWIISRCRQISSFDGPQNDEQFSNVRRIVACANACAGIPIDMLEAMPSGPASLLPMYARLEKQCDELLAAAERQFNVDHVLINMPHGCTKDEHETALNEHTNAHYELRKVIARVKGQQ